MTISDMPPESSKPATLTGVVPVTYVQSLYEYLQARSVNAPALLGAGQPQTEQGLGRFPVAKWQRYLSIAAKHLDDPLLGLHLGASISPRHFGLLGYVLLACGNMGGALQRLEQYHQLIYDVNPMQVEVDDAAIQLVWGQEMGQPGALVDETAITALVQFCREITNQPQLCPAHVSFINPSPKNTTPYENWFGCPVHFAQDVTRIVFPVKWLQLPLRSADPALVSILEKQADALLESLPQPTADPLANDIRQRLATQLHQREPSASDLASQLNVTVRTLHRRLAAQDHSFRALLQSTRHHLAKTYLQDLRLQLAEIALLLGYSEQSAFNRAFKQWQGQTPLQYRREIS